MALKPPVHVVLHDTVRHQHGRHIAGVRLPELALLDQLVGQRRTLPRFMKVLQTLPKDHVDLRPSRLLLNPGQSVV